MEPFLDAPAMSPAALPVAMETPISCRAGLRMRFGLLKVDMCSARGCC